MEKKDHSGVPTLEHDSQPICIRLTVVSQTKGPEKCGAEFT